MANWRIKRSSQPSVAGLLVKSLCASRSVKWRRFVAGSLLGLFAQVFSVASQKKRETPTQSAGRVTWREIVPLLGEWSFCVFVTQTVERIIIILIIIIIDVDSISGL